MQPLPAPPPVTAAPTQGLPPDAVSSFDELGGVDEGAGAMRWSSTRQKNEEDKEHQRDQSRRGNKNSPKQRTPKIGKLLYVFVSPLS